MRYNQFHTTALCSPTRGALLTGRNHHSIGTGVIIELGTGFPGYTGIVPNTTAGLPEMLRQNGYATSGFGKWHNTPDVEITPSGPFDRWPSGKTWGFEYFYGFMNGETHQNYPVLYRNTTPVAQPKDALRKPGQCRATMRVISRLNFWAPGFRPSVCNVSH